MKRLLRTLPPLFLASAAFAADGGWSVDADGNWSDTTKWAAGILADGADFKATFTNDLTADRVVTIDAPHTLGGLIFGDASTGTAAGWTLSGSTLTLATTTGTPTITINALGAGKTATIASVLAGTGGLAITSAGSNGTVTLSGTNTYSGTTTISSQANGAPGVVVANAAAFGTSSVLVNGSNQFNAGISVNAGLTVNNALTLKSINSGTARAILSLGTGSTWSGNIVVDSSAAPISGFAAIVGGGTTAATASTVSGNISYVSGTNTNALVLRGAFGQVTGNIALGGATLQLLDASSWMISGATNSWGKLDINHASAVVYVGAANTLASGGVVTATGAAGTLRLNNQAGTAAFSQTVAGLDGIVKVGLQTGAATLTLNTSANQASSGVISNAVALVKSGAASQTLTGTNTFTGGVTINAGSLITGNTAALGSGNVSVAAAGTLQVGNGTVNGVTLGSGATLTTATGATLKFSSLAAGITMSGVFTVGADTKIDITGLNLASGSYTLITSSVSGGTLGAWDGATDIVGGSGGTTYALALSGNNLVLTATAVPEPSAYGLAGAGALAAIALVRRRRRAGR